MIAIIDVIAVNRAQQDMPDSMSRGNSLTTDTGDASHPSLPPSLRMNLHVGVLHYDPSFEPFPLLTDPVNYEPNTVDISGDKHMLDYWLTVLSDSIPTIMAKAVASEGGKPGVAPPPPTPPPHPLPCLQPAHKVPTHHHGKGCRQ